MTDHLSFIYPEDRGTARQWLAEKRVSEAELEKCLRIQRSQAPPPKTLKEIGHLLGYHKRFPVPEAIRLFEQEAKHSLAQDRVIRDHIDGRAPPPHYSLVRRMGGGGQGDVFMAQQYEPRRLVVLKRLLSELALDGKSVLRFLREAVLMERVNDPQVVKVFDYGTYEETYFIALEYVAGESLADRLKREGRIPVTDALALTSYAAEALAAVADGEVVHADVKPSNFVIPVRDPSIKLIDFGAAVEAGTPQSDDGGWFGSPPFMAPEQFRGEPLTPATDMYALGITLFLMLTGEFPFLGGTSVETGRKHMEEPLPSLLAEIPGLSPRVAHLVRHMTEKDPAGRWPSFYELMVEIHRIEEQLEDEEVEESPGPGRVPKPKTSPRPERTVSARAEGTEEAAESPPGPPRPADTGG